MAMQQVFNPLSGQFDLVSLLTLTTVGSSPNANAASLTNQALTLQPFDATNPGVVTASGGGTTNFLRADATWSPIPLTAAGSNGQVQFNSSGLLGASSQFNWDNTNHGLKVGPGASAAVSTLTQANIYISSQGVGEDHGFVNENANNNASSPGQFVCRRARGTLASPVAIALNDLMGSYGVHGYDGTAYNGPDDANIIFQASEPAGFAVGAHGTQIRIGVTKNGTTTRHLALLIDNDSSLSIYNDSGAQSTKIINTATTNLTLSLPTDAGSSGYQLTTDGAGITSWTAPTVLPVNQKELTVLSSGDITNQYIDLAHVAMVDSILFVVQGGNTQIEGASYDYSVNYTGGAGGNTRITFLNGLATGGVSELVAGDVVVAQYQY